MFNKHEVPSAYIKKWQKTVDLAAELLDISAAQIHRVWPDRLEVLVKSNNGANPFTLGGMTPLGRGTYCEVVMQQKKPLMVFDARDDSIWQGNPEQASNMVCYMGVPLLWPDTTVFGTLCVFNVEPRHFSKSHQLLMGQLKEVIEGDCRLIHYSRELQQRKLELENLVDERTEHLRLLLESTAEAIYGIDLQGKCTFSNPACLRMLGYTCPDDLLGRNMHALIHHHYADGSNYDVCDCPILHAMVEGKGCHIDHEVLWRGDGSSFQAEYWAYPQMHEGKVVGAVVTFWDISDRRQAEATAQHALERLKLATGVTRIGIWDWDIVNNKLVWDDSMYKLYGIDKDQFGGAYEAWTRSLAPEDLVRAKGRIEQALKGGPDFDAEFKIIWPDGSKHYIQAASQIFRNAEGQPLRMIGVNYDTTERRRNEDEIRKLNTELEDRVNKRTAQLEEMFKELESFSYTVSHDLRAPLRAIDGFSFMLLDECSEQLDANGQLYLGRIRSNAQLMGRLIDDLLELAQIGQKSTAAVLTDLSAMARTILFDLSAAEPERQVRTVINEVPNVTCDVGLAQIILQNLISNAWKYTRRRSVATIEFGSCLIDNQPAYYVRDNGAGFDMAQTDKLFRPFSRLHSSKEFEGSGIGLATVKKAVSKHHGKIWAEAATDEGACFYFTLNAI